MPKHEIDYSNTIIYKIVCKNTLITDTYIGHTTSFIKRKYQHKLCCNNLNNKLKIYEAIRNNGGWNNWEMIEIATYNCKNSEEARIKEQEHYEEFKTPLNSVKPYLDHLYNKHFICNNCNYNTINKKDFNRHIITQKHIKMTPELQMNYNIIQLHKYTCECGNKYKYRQGLWKHKQLCKHKPSIDSYKNNEITVLTKLVENVINQNQYLNDKIMDIYSSKL